MICAIEDAGFEIRDCIAWAYSTGFPKSLSIDKAIDSHEKNKWLNVVKIIDNISTKDVLGKWKNHLKNANNAGVSFQKKKTEVGINTPKNDFVHDHVVLPINQKKYNASAIIAELSLNEHHHIKEAQGFIAQKNAEVKTKALLSHAINAENPQENQNVTIQGGGGIAQCDAKGWLNGKTMDKIKDAEALKTWLSKTRFSGKADINALCAALTETLKLTILNQSKTFQNYDTALQTDCVSAINVIITESTAENLISFTVNTLKKIAIDKA
ncbi:MAG: hypothetical protein R6U66_14515, partial [Bacteroidales bacterium]